MPGHYVATATAALWVAVTPQTITAPVPSFADVGIAGAVQPASYRTAKAVNVCHIRDDHGRVVGFSLSCPETKK
jgi:hypothetical protein